MTSSPSRACKLCGKSLAAEDCYVGVKTRCKDCHKARMRELRLTNPEFQERDRARAKQPQRKAMSRQNTIKWRNQHPDAYRAQTAVGNALRDGKLRKDPCAICGATSHVHAHHTDYKKPLDVRWLCAKCHHRIHAAFPELGGHGAQA